MPFLRKSIFSNVPPTIIFYTKGHKGLHFFFFLHIIFSVKKPSTKFLNHLTWCHNSLLPVVIRQSLNASHFKIVDEAINWIGYWGRHLKTSQYHEIKPYQKVKTFYLCYLLFFYRLIIFPVHFILEEKIVSGNI